MVVDDLGLNFHGFVNEDIVGWQGGDAVVEYGSDIVGVVATVLQVIAVMRCGHVVADTQLVAVYLVRNCRGGGFPTQFDRLAVKVGGKVGGTVEEQGVDGGQSIDAA